MGLRQRHRQQEPAAPIPARESQLAGNEMKVSAPSCKDYLAELSRSWIIAGLVAVLVGIAYIETMAPSIVGGDNSELVAAACQVSVAHPPGYPLLTLLGALAGRLIPVGEFAYRVNLLNMGMGALSAVTVFATARHVARSEISGMVAAIIFGLHPLTWLYHGHYEVFALNNLLCGIIVYLAVLFETVSLPSPGLALLGALLSGLAISNQHTSVLLVGPIALRVLWRLYQHGRLTRALLLGLIWNALVGLSPYAFLPLSSASNPQGGWGDQTTLSGFLVHFLRHEYGTFQLYSGKDRAQTGGTFFLGLYLYLTDFVKSSYYLLAFCGLLGCIMAVRVPASWRPAPAQGETTPAPAPSSNKKGTAQPPPSANSKKETGPSGASKATEGVAGQGPTQAAALEEDNSGIVRSWRLLLALLVFYNVVFQFLSNIPLDNPLSLSVQQRFWMQSNLLASIFVGLGTSEVFEAIFNRQPQSEDAAAVAALLAARLGRPAPPTKTVGEVQAQQREKRRAWQRAVAMSVGALLCLLARARNMEAASQENNRYFYRYGQEHLAHLPQGSLLLLTGDMHYYPAGYVQWCEGYRPDVRLLELSMASYDWFAPRYGRHLPGVVIPGARYVEAKSPRDKSSWNMKELFDANVARMPVYVLDWMEGDTSPHGHYDLIPYGIVQRALPKAESAALDLAKWANESLAACADLMLPDAKK
eukprot:jgi/Mesvir1/5287/Mv15392-RA.2